MDTGYIKKMYKELVANDGEQGQPIKLPDGIQFPSFYFTPIRKTSTTVEQNTTSLKFINK